MGELVNFAQPTDKKRVTGRGTSGYVINDGEGEKRVDNNKILEIYIEKVDKDQASLKEDIREFEKRTEKRIQDSEERMDKRLDKIEGMITSQNEKIEKLSEKITELDGTVRDRLEDHKRFLWGIAFSVIIGIAGMVIAVIITL
nr:hypothetical protein [uncultured Anaerostipes sp.]